MGQDEIQNGYYREKYRELEGIKEHADAICILNCDAQPLPIPDAR